MKAFDVTVQRTEFREHTFRIEAESAEDAFNLGLSRAARHDFRDDPVEEAGESVTRLLPISGDSNK